MGRPPMAQGAFGLPQQQQQSGARTPAAGAGSVGAGGASTPVTGGFASTPGSTTAGSNAGSRVSSGFPFGAGGGGGALGQSQQGHLQQQQNGISAATLNQQQQQQPLNNSQGPPSTTPSHQSIFSHPSDIQSVANNQGLNGNNASLDLSDFPALGSLQQPLQTPSSGAGGNTPHSYAAQANAALLQQQQQQQQQQQMTSGGASRANLNFNSADEFPALGGEGMVNGAGNMGNSNQQNPAMEAVGAKYARGLEEQRNHASKLAQQQSSTAWSAQIATAGSAPTAEQLLNPNQQQQPQRSTSGSYSNGGNATQQSQQQQYDQHPAAPGLEFNPANPAHQVLTSPADKWGLLGFLHAIRTSDEDKSVLAYGTDLMNLGVDMGSTDPLYSSLVAPWAEPSATKSVHVEEPYQLPACYNVRPQTSAQNKMNHFHDETLFFMFYSSPRDILQEHAAAELFARHWRWHKEHQCWLTKDPEASATFKDTTGERGTYVFWDPITWSRVEQKDFSLMYDSLEDRPVLSQQTHQQLQQGQPTPLIQQQQRQAQQSTGMAGI